MNKVQTYTLLLFAVGISASSCLSPSYIGAVVDYRPITEGKNGLEVAQQNADHFKTIVKKASKYNVDIIVFPENSLTSLSVNFSWTVDKIREHYYFAASYIPDPKENVVLCYSNNKYTQALKSISCIARDYKTYVVVNHYEKVDCPQRDCSKDGFLLYNTNVVFDRSGHLIARYRKYNLFYEPGINITAEPELSIFNTDFGVKFGQIICNDILYVRPALELLKNHNVTDVAYSAEWFSELPFLTSVQIHSAWALANDVNLLSSGFNEPAITNGGSGIYIGRKGVVKATIPNVSANVLIVSEIPKIINGHRQNLPNSVSPKVYKFTQEEIPTVWDNTKDFLYKDNFNVYTTEKIDLKYSSYNKTICNRGLCCDFKLQSSFNEKLIEGSGVHYYRYRVGVFNGVRLFAGKFTVGIEVCGVFFCKNDSIASCGERFGTDVNIVEPTTFHSIVIERKNDQDDRKLYLPVTLTKSLLPIDASKISYKVSSGKNGIFKMALTKSENSLMTFAIYGRNLAKDGSELTKPST